VVYFYVICAAFRFTGSCYLTVSEHFELIEKNYLINIDVSINQLKFNLHQLYLVLSVFTCFRTSGNTGAKRSVISKISNVIARQRGSPSVFWRPFQNYLRRPWLLLSFAGKHIGNLVSPPLCHSHGRGPEGIFREWFQGFPVIALVWFFFRFVFMLTVFEKRTGTCFYRHKNQDT